MSAASTVELKLINRWLEPNPHKPGSADWCIRGTGLPVWRVVGQLAVEAGDDDPAGYAATIGRDPRQELVERVAGYYDVAPEAVSAALAYARRHLQEIIARLVLDRAAQSG